MNPREPGVSQRAEQNRWTMAFIVGKLHGERPSMAINGTPSGSPISRRAEDWWVKI
jgi:hypothetical protein